MGRPKTYDRDEVLVRAMDLFWKEGFAGAHLGKLVEATGLNRFSLYKEFGGKEGLFEEALQRYLESARGAYAEHLKRAPYGLDNIRSYFSALHYGPDYHGCFMINTLTEKHIVSEKAFNLAKRFSNEAERLYLKNLKVAQSLGEISVEADPRVLAKALMAMDRGLAVYGITQSGERTKDQIVNLLLERLLVGGPHG
jgi:TetR/AcrR family transcriptional repressor of nem operon